MKHNTQKRILDLITEKSQIKPHDLKNSLGISTVSIHKHLKKLLDAKKIMRHGKPPLVFYTLNTSVSLETIEIGKIAQPDQQVIHQNFVYFTPEGEFLSGVSAFIHWVQHTGQKAHLEFLAREFVQIRQKADQFFDPNHAFIRALFKLNQTFPETFLDELFYQDFYSLPKFGRTILGHKVLHAKQSQNLPLIQALATFCRPTILNIIEHYHINHIGWIPHSIPRKIPFLKAFKEFLKLDYPTINIVKAYAGEIPIAQKSLSKLEERIENAQKTFFINNPPQQVDNLLLLDDALGSGATLNEVARKIRQLVNPKKIYGYVICGSYKGFEVIREV